MKRTVWLLVTALAFAGAAWGQGAHSVTLTWTASPDTGPAIGYNVFRGAASGGEGATPLNAAPAAVNCSGATCTYTDSGVTAGAKYFYEVAAVSTTSGVESAMSNEASCTVPLAAPGTLAVTAK